MKGQAHMDKTTLIETLHTNRAAWEALLAQIPKDHLLLSGATGTWSVKDVIAHIMWSEREMVTLCETRDMSNGSNLWVLSEDERNAIVVAEQKDRTLQEVRAEEQQIYTRLEALLQTLSEEDLTNPHNFRGMPENWLPWQIIAGCSFKHYRDHMPAIQQWLEQNN
jgi:DinB superfamily